jgi:hypothetical protein
VTSLLGQFTATGVCLVIAVWLIVGHRGKGKLAEVHEDRHTAYWMLAFGMFAQGAGQTFSAPQQVGDSLTAAVNAQFNAGAGAISMLLMIVLWGCKPRVWKDVIVGATLPSAALAAGNLLALPVITISAFLHGLVGA